MDKMIDKDYYPPGAAHDPRAPYNEPGPRMFEVYITTEVEAYDVEDAIKQAKAGEGKITYSEAEEL